MAGTVRISFYDILTMFEVDNSAEDAYTDDFEIARSGLQQLRKHISEQDETFRQNAEEFYSCLAKVGMDREKFIEVLDCLINGSDQAMPMCMSHGFNDMP